MKFNKKTVILTPCLILSMLAAWVQPATAQNGVQGSIQTIPAFISLKVNPRRVDVWLPPDYDSTGRTKYNVIYMEDGQNAFDPATSSQGVDWRVDEHLSKLIAARSVAPTIVVAIWNTAKRYNEYNPNAPYSALPDSFRTLLDTERGAGNYSDKYLQFLVTELKPYIESHFPVYKNAKHNFLLGSSTGALINLYAICSYPKVFGGAMCMSTNWPVSLKYPECGIGNTYAEYFGSHLPEPTHAKLYFDY